MTDIIFIGGGPVGLLAAIQLKLTRPEIEILVFEKYEVPVRNHAMYVEKSSFAKMNKSRGFGEIIDNLSSKVIISDLELTLRSYATSIGINIQYEEIKDFSELEDRYPNTKYFVGSGGLRGIIHPQIFDSANQVNQPLRYAVEVKYKAQGEARLLNKLTELPGVLANFPHFVSEYVGHLKEGVTPVSLRIFIDESTYQAMKPATFKNWYTLADQSKIPPSLFNSIQTYLTGRRLLAKETIDASTLKISTITLSLYASQDFCTKTRNGKSIFKLGEEAFACPFYRSFNDNVSCIPFFTTAMDALFQHKQIESKQIGSNSIFSSKPITQDPLNYYQRSIQKFVDREIKTIHLLNTGIDIVESSIGSSRYAPSIASSSLLLMPRGRAFLQEINPDNAIDCTTSCTLS